MARLAFCWARRGAALALALFALVEVGMAQPEPVAGGKTMAETAPATAFQLPSVIGSHMVLQRETAAAIWGWDVPGQKVTVSFRGKDAAATAEADGKWQVRVATGAAGGPFTLAIAGSQAQTLDDVLVGEVWVAGGQSNMWWHVDSCADYEQVKAAATDGELRVWDANTAARQNGYMAATPQRTVPAAWARDTPEDVGRFPGTAYFFGRALRKALGVPVGIVHVAVPGSEIEPFLSPQYGDYFYKGLEKHPPTGGFWNGMIVPTAPFTARGFIWWQGESNSDRPEMYRVLFPALIEQWRQLWGDERLPFLYVDLANFLAKQTHPVEDAGWPQIRDAQRAALALHDVYRVNAIDILRDGVDGVNNIHPPYKQLAGERLALAALANVYGQNNLVWTGPTLAKARFADGAATLTFEHVGTGLRVKGDGGLKGFAICGTDRVWHWGAAKTAGKDEVIVRSADVAAPVAVRYDWANNPIGTLENSAELPAFQFRTDAWVLGVE